MLLAAPDLLFVDVEVNFDLKTALLTGAPVSQYIPAASQYALVRLAPVETQSSTLSCQVSFMIVTCAACSTRRPNSVHRSTGKDAASIEWPCSRSEHASNYAYGTGGSVPSMQRLHPLVLCDASLRQAPFRRQRVFPASTSPTWKAGKTALPSSWVWLTTLRDTSAVLDFSSQYAFTWRVMSMQHAIPDPATNYSALFCRWLGSRFQTQLLDFHDILTCKHVICTLLPQSLPFSLNPPACSATPAQLDSLHTA